MPVDRIAVTGWVLVAFIFANAGKTMKDQIAMIRDWSIFAGILFAYEYSRGLSDQLGRPISYLAVRNIDRALFFGTDPNVWMQQHLNVSKVLSWYEYPLAVTYMTHFIFPPGVAVLLWWINRDMWVRYMRRLGILFFLACATFAAFPVAPPWLAAKQGYIAPIHRITARAWSHMGIKSVSKVFDRGTAITNPYAAMPSLHAGCALLVVLFFFPYMPKWIRVISLALPASMAVCLVYFGEHYVADILAGWLYVGVAIWISTKWEKRNSGAVKAQRAR
ncbi:MAG: hypothetical protein ABR76_07350 [Acidimicrobiia bacterium BACL6 MAG-121220-bin61]|uniref:Inositolphosphotransferase Aur1/Ipt1 domain-containing protein n=1 Tax=Acidimicrobiia bacterium BACL6 MAG-120924-bin43 TaxID=1655583 RepID=A0A0R2QH88_9ACTN|nr:MAG: hypothetical protein ABR75_02445 [Acidimicrobiia bacterium BACL6 MAG-120924-bin43]KRO53617.1 MAG: hypothetical protein ABR78_09485 [Acidimicrobiia bacterium BACL6 MAG-120910-bin40]KRO58045.1 MAG: hypothetical protein ABR77_00625 [Acidimicrobiia bacterium BACL6 MAG-120322-bin79]KRO64012.1 MAG: hypothetical protein ABR76_07350 [Acidimicrobiia bacterium BACL6 MAG-121220-bin61]